MTPIQSRFATLASTTLLVSSLALLSACGGGDSGTAATDTSSTTGSTSSTGDTSSTTTTPAQTIDVAGKVFISTKDTSKGMLLLNAGSNGTAYTQETGKSAQAAPFTWNLNSADLTLAFAGSTSSFKVAQDSSTLTMSTDSTKTFTQAKPLTLAALNGKHFADEISAADLAADEDKCTARTFSFSGSALNVRERCDGQFFSFDLPGGVSEVPGLSNLVQFSFTEGTVTSTNYIALADGDINSKGTIVIANTENGVLDGLETDIWTAVSAPLQP